MNRLERMAKFHLILPVLGDWIEKTLAENLTRAVPVIKFDWPMLPKVFPRELLRNAKVVVVSGNVPFPPLGSLGVDEFAHMEKMSRSGITYKDTYFVNRSHQSESLHFHELVHVVQWEQLGVDRFLLAYGAGLMQFGYADSPLEKMAYRLQADFDRGFLPGNLIEFIQQRSEAIWQSVAPLLGPKTVSMRQP